jgi:Leucine-rich repeat (LRR) protein
MKKLYFIFIFSFIIFTSYSQVISFNDDTFKSKLLESSPGNFIAQNLNGDYFAIDANSNNQIEESEAIQVSALDINNATITSLNGINFFTNLISLNCENNLLTGLNVSNLTNLTSLNCSNNQLANLNVNDLPELRNLNCQFNQLINLNVSNITNLTFLDCSYNQIATINFNNLLNLEELNCSNNQIADFELSDLISLKLLDCNNNLLNAINTSNLINLETLNCSSNVLASITISNLINFNELNCSNNILTTLSLNNLDNLTDLNCSFNQLTLINLNGLVRLKNVNCNNNLILFLNLSSSTLLEELNADNNQISSLVLIGLSQLITLNCNTNQIVNLDLSGLSSLKYLNCNSNFLNSLNTNGLIELLVLSCTNNQITSLNLTSLINLQSVYCNNNQITTLDLSNAFNLQNLFCFNNQLTSLFIKNGSFEVNLLFSNNPTLNYICADEFQIEFIQDEINNNNYTNCHVNSYCTFIPGGLSYTIQGNAKFDSNTNGCDVLDNMFPNLKMSFSDGSITENLISNTSGNYSKSVKEGTYTVTPFLENPNYFFISPSTVSVEFPFQSSPLLQNFCVLSNGNHADLEIAFLPLNNANPGQDANYKIVYKNKGTITQSGNVSLNFNDAVLDFLNSNPVTTNQSLNNLNWSFSNLQPFESRSIVVSLRVNATTDVPSVNVGQLLPFTALVSSSNTDELPNDNSITLNQKVVNTTITNDKVCIEGTSVSPSQIGDYLHYGIRFKNTGTAIAQNIVVKDIIDTSKFDVNSLIPLDGSHLFETKISNTNTVEFIFKNINLAFGVNNSEGFVLFKIKTLASLSIGNSVSNTASIYFDYLSPTITNIETTSFESLGNQTIETSGIKIYPNPVKDILNIQTENSIFVEAISIYNSLGQVIQTITNPNNLSINVATLRTGVYYLTVSSENRSSTIRFIKE